MQTEISFSNLDLLPFICFQKPYLENINFFLTICDLKCIKEMLGFIEIPIVNINPNC